MFAATFWSHFDFIYRGKSQDRQLESTPTRQWFDSLRILFVRGPIVASNSACVELTRQVEQIILCVPRHTPSRTRFTI